MFRLGLTGSIATGKSTVLEEFCRLGFPTFSADEAVHELYGGAGAPAVEALFPGVVTDGQVDRGALAARLLAEPGRLPELEAVVHPLVRLRLERFFEDAEAVGAQLAVADIPLLFETGFDYGLDAVVTTWCTPEEQRRRALARSGMTVEKLDTILARQLPQAEKRARARFAIGTDGSIEQTREAARALASAIVQGSAAEGGGSAE